MSLFNNDNASDNMNSGGEDASERNRQHNTEPCIRVEVGSASSRCLHWI